MKNITPKISWFGIALILVGAVLLLDRFHILHLAFSTVFWPIVMVLALIGVGRGFSQNRRGKIFWNTVWFLYGLFFLSPEFGFCGNQKPYADACDIFDSWHCISHDLFQ